MGSTVLHSRLLTLTCRRHDIQFMVTLLNNRQQQLMWQQSCLWSQLYNQGTQGDGTNPYEAYLEGLKNQEKIIDIQRKNLETQLKTVETEYESTKKQLDKNIKVEYNNYG